MRNVIKHYLANPNLKKINVVLDLSEDQVREFVRCAQDPIYFIENYVKIITLDKGFVQIKLYPFQKQAVTDINDNRRVIVKAGRQVGKTTMVVGYILWYILFNEDKFVAILANKAPTAREILNRIKIAYESLPMWLQQGVRTWNKGDIELENNCRVMATSTASSAIRGFSISLLYLDEFAFVPPNMQEDFFASVYPTISSGKTTKVLITSTPNGLNMFYKMWIDAIEGRSTYKPLEVHWSEVPGRDAAWKEETIRNTSEEQFRQEFETEFIGSSATLISGSKLRSLAFHNPISSNDGLDIYEEPIKDKLYICTVDCAEGVEQDYSTINVIDVSQTPYRQVAKYRNNKLPLLFFPTVIYSIAKKYNEAYALIETNNIGQQVVDILHYDLEYEHVYKLEHHHIKGQAISGGFKRSTSFGIKTTKSVKKIGCANLKTLIENDKLIINDFDTIAEMNTFVRVRDSYAAEEGNNDDLVMGLVLFSWLSAQSYFRDSTNIDIRRVLLQENSTFEEENLTPVGIIDDGRKEELINDGRDIWYTHGAVSSSF